jgi:hypothetical protein
VKRVIAIISIPKGMTKHDAAMLLDSSIEGFFPDVTVYDSLDELKLDVADGFLSSKTLGDLSRSRRRRRST